MKKIRKLTAVLLAAVMLMTISSVSAGAMTVVRDGKEYTLETHTPATGDVHVLMVRLGFADYGVDDAKNPAVSGQTLLSYFDGSEDSVNAYYEVSSYGQLHLHCDEVFTYTAPLVRAEYDSGNRSASSSPEGLIAESLTSHKDQIDFDKYDSNNDGCLDVVCFNYACPTGAWNSTWWPYVDNADITVENKKIEKYAFLKEAPAL